jgi:diaminohydroxyphosphoribosylaminopyrimidine deaminase/5-amino-6-(5-phosphoribosylamino)uracil reductase
VVFGASDPGAATGGGAELLEQAGVEVVGPAADVGTFHDVDPVFFHTSTYRRPYVALKLAVSLDGRIAAREGERTLLTGDEANREVHRLRSGFDAVLVGGETARIDDPLLTVRYGFDPRIQPTRVVVDPRATLSPDASMFGDGSEAPVVVFTTEAAPAERVEALGDVGAQVEIVPQGGGGANLGKMLERCWHLGLCSVFCEGGARLATVLAREGLAQRFYVFQAPVTLGSQGVPAFEGESSTPEGLGWSSRGEPMQFGPDVLITYDYQGG